MEHTLDKENRRLADYIYNDLSPEERVDLERELSENAELSESYVLNKQVVDYLRTKIQLKEMRSDPMLENAEKLADKAFEKASDGEERQQVIPINRKRIRIRNLTFAVAIAASIAVLITVGTPFGVDQDKLYDRYYDPLEASDYSQRGESNEAYRDVATGINNYLNGNYEQSIEQFSQLATVPAFRSEAQFYTALSRLGLGQYQDAQSIFESYITNENRYHLESLWYLSLCYLKTGEIDQASKHLGQLEKYSGMYQKDAKTLRKKLDRLK